MASPGSSGWFRGSLVGLQSSGYQLVTARIEQYRTLLAFCRSADHPGADILDAARDALENRIWWLIPYPKYDLAFARLFQLRNLFCQQLELPELLGVILPEIAEDLDYPGVRPEQRESIEALRKNLEGIVAKKDTPEETLLRTQLEELSQFAAQARQAHWLKVNMSRNRLALMGMLGLALLGTALTLMHMRTGRSLWVALFGALGGLVSSVMTTESVETKISEYYLNRRVLYLRPVLGAIIAFIVYLAIRSNLFSIAGINGAKATVDEYLVIAFVSGFAERAVVGKLLDVVNVGQAKQGAAAQSPPQTAQGPSQAKPQ